MKYFIQKRNSNLLKIYRGYQKLKKNNNLIFIDDIKRQLTSTPLFTSNKINTCLIIDSNEVNLEICARQLILSRYTGIEFNKEILKTFSNNNYKFSYSLPLVWLKVLKNNHIRVNLIRSSFLWHIEILKYFIFSFHEIFIQSKRTIISIFNNEFKNDESFVYFDSLVHSNLPNKNGTFKYGIFPWYLKWRSEVGANFFAHSVPNHDGFFLNDKVRVDYLKHQFSSPRTIIKLFKFVIFSFWKIFQSTTLLFFGKWWNLLLLKEFLLSEVVKLNKGKGLAKTYLFHNSSWIYRPIWTYSAEKIGTEILFYFYSTNIERFKKIDEQAKIPNSWEIVTWSNLLVWDKYQEDFIKKNVLHKNKIKIVGPIEFNASKDLEIGIMQNSIAIFDVQPVRTSFYISLGMDQEYYTPEITNIFLDDIVECASICGLNVSFKRKRNIKKLSNTKYTNKLKQLANNKIFNNIDPLITAEQIIEKSKATISMPFTSTALIAKFMDKPSVFYDPSCIIQKDDIAAHGIEIISNKVDLLNWMSKL